MNPHFEGESIVRVGLTGRITRRGDGAMGGFMAGPTRPGPSRIPAVTPSFFDAPDFRLHDGLAFPLTTQARIAAFAHEVSLFASPGGTPSRRRAR